MENIDWRVLKMDQKLLLRTSPRQHSLLEELYYQVNQVATYLMGHIKQTFVSDLYSTSPWPGHRDEEYIAPHLNYRYVSHTCSS